jgi:hypothetical protein
MRKERRCTKCNKSVSKNCKTGVCNHCRDRTGANNPFFGKKHKDVTIANMKQKNSEISKEKWLDEEYRKKVVQGISKPRKESFKQEQSERVRQWYVDNPEQRILRSGHMKKSWQNDKIQPQIKKSKIETDFFNSLSSRHSDIIRNPVIRLPEGRSLIPDCLFQYNKVIVEFFGNYYHANPEIYKPNDIVLGSTAHEIWKRDAERIHILESMGYVVFEVWESEYKKNRNEVLSRFDFMDWDTCCF